MTTHTSGTQREFTRLAWSIAAFGVGVSTDPLAWQAASPPATLPDGIAGTPIAASIQVRSLQPRNALAWIATNTGSVVGQCVFPGVADRPLIVRQSRRHAAMQLCHASTTARCTSLAGIWAGSLHPTPAAGSALDFGRHRLLTGNLALPLTPGAAALALVPAAPAPTGVACTNPRAGPVSPP